MRWPDNALNRTRPKAPRRLADSLGVMRMHYDPDVFTNQFPIVKGFVYHLTYYRALLTGYRERGLQDEFWTLTIDAHLLRATINWCMVFGSDKTNPTHWKRLSAKESEKLYKSFRSGLSQETGLNEQQWQRYRNSMVDFRNKYAAHREWNFNNPVPNFDIALAVAYHYDNWVRNVISPDVFDEPPIEEFAISLYRSSTQLIGKLFGVTIDAAEPCAAGDAQTAARP